MYEYAIGETLPYSYTYCRIDVRLVHFASAMSHLLVSAGRNNGFRTARLRSVGHACLLSSNRIMGQSHDGRNRQKSEHVWAKVAWFALGIQAPGSHSASKANHWSGCSPITSSRIEQMRFWMSSAVRGRSGMIGG